MATLILLRHGQSLWNSANKFTGWVDVPLSQQGRAEATIAGCKLKRHGDRIDLCFTSLLFRAMETAILCLQECQRGCDGKVPIFKHDAADANWHGWDSYDGNPQEELPIFPSSALDERYYGALQGLNKTETADQYGADRVNLWRRSFTVRPPGGESLEDTLNRTVPYFRDRILPHLLQGDNLLVVAHGNSLRSIIMHLERLSPAAVETLELTTGIPVIYRLDAQAQVQEKWILH